MKILQVVQFLSPMYGGSSEYPFCISRELSRRGHAVTIFTSDYNLSHEWTKSLGQVKVIPFSTWSSWSNFYLTPAMIGEAREKIKHFEIIHMHNYRSFQNIIANHYTTKYSVPYILQAHGSLPRIMAKQKLKWIYDKFFGYKLLKEASSVIALSQIEAKQYLDMGVNNEKIAIIPNGIDISEYTNLPLRGSFKKEFKIFY